MHGSSHLVTACGVLIPLGFYVHIRTQQCGVHLSRIANRYYTMSCIAAKTGRGQTRESSEALHNTGRN